LVILILMHVLSSKSFKNIEETVGHRQVTQAGSALPNHKC